MTKDIKLLEVNNCEFYEEISNRNKKSMTKIQKEYFVDITNEFMKNANPKMNMGIKKAKSVVKDGVKYQVNDRNKIIIKNKEIENALWYLNLMGGRIELLPEIGEERSIQMADYMYYSTSGECYFLENKEIILEKNQKTVGKNNFLHKIEEGILQSNVFIIDCSNSNLTDKEILMRLEVVFKNSKLIDYEKILIIKNGEDLFGVFTNRKK